MNPELPEAIVGACQVTCTTPDHRTQFRALHMISLRIIACFALAAFQAGWAQVSVTTYHNDNARTGQNLNETILTPANVNPNGFGRLFVQPVDGYIYAQPLYVPAVSIGGQAHNVVFVATENDSVYAFDADNTVGANAIPLWQVSFINPPSVTTVDSATDIECTDLVPQIGITGTPVIDPSTGTLYVVAKTNENGVFVQRLHALDITTGNEKFGGPVVIQATVPGTGDGSSQIVFDALHQNQRPGLLLDNGLVYIAWAAHCDHPPFHAWVLGYDASTLQQVVVWNSTPNGSDGGVWQSGGGPAADSTGIYFATGNGTFDGNTGGTDWGDTILKMSGPTGGTLQVLSYFTPFNQAVLFDDQDLGSGGVVLLPDLPVGSAHQQLLVQSGKEGSIYLVDRNNMGGYNPTTDQVVQELPEATGGIWGMPAYWNNTVYFGAQTDNLKAFSFNANGSGLLSSLPVSQSPEIFGYPGPTPSISANGSGNGILWAIQTDAFASNGPAVLRAYDATNLANELYNSTQNGSMDTPGPAVKFAAATVVNGKVYAGTASQLAVYGLLAPFSDVPPSNAFFNFIKVMYETGITGGCATNPLEYCPDATITRGEMAVFIITAMFGGSNFSYTTTPYFNDVPASNGFFKFIQKMKDLGISAGCGSNNFCPDDPVTRGEMAVFIMIARYGTIPLNYPVFPYFTDVSASSSYFPFIQKMAQLGITGGCAVGVYCPNDSLTRGQMAVFIVTGLLDQLLPLTTPLISQVAPNAGSTGQALTVTISGIGTNFGAGTQVAAPTGITVSNVTVLSPNSLTVQLNISASAVPSLTATNGSLYTIAVTTGSAEADLPNGFTVQ
jgi:hypothetical protein